MWCGYLSGARCRLFAYGATDATAIPIPCHLLPHLKPDWFLPVWYWLVQVVLEKMPLNGCSSSSYVDLILHMRRCGEADRRSRALASDIWQVEWCAGWYRRGRVWEWDEPVWVFSVDDNHRLTAASAASCACILLTTCRCNNVKLQSFCLRRRAGNND